MIKKLIKLSKRLETVASFVPEGSCIADIGTDHGYVPIYLIETGRATRAIAMDVREGPLLRAAEHIKKAGLQDRVEVRFSDGLFGLEENEVDCAIMAGMGGELILHILKEGKRLWKSIPRFVLSPQSDIDKVRKFLEKESFFISRETMIEEEGKYYTVLLAGYKPEMAAREEEKREVFFLYGKRLMESRNPVLCEYLKKEEQQLCGIFAALAGQESPAAKKRRQELRQLLDWNKEAQDEMENIGRNTGEAGAAGMCL